MSKTAVSTKTKLLLGLMLICAVTGILFYAAVDNGGRYEMPSDQVPSHSTGLLVPQEQASDAGAGKDGLSFAPIDSSPEPPESRMPDFSNYQFIGTARGIDDSPRAVIIDDRTGNQALYAMGDAIGPGHIKEIHPHQVMIEAGGIIHVLSLQRPADDEESPSLPDRDQQPPEFNPLLQDARARVEREWGETQELMIQVELSQNFTDDQPNGIRVDRVSPGSVFDRIGLKAGDVILQIDDMRLEIEDDAMEIYNSLRTRDKLEFTVIRDQQTQILTYDGRPAP